MNQKTILRQGPTRSIVLAAVSTGLVLVVTYFISVPLPAAPGQVFNAGDVIIVASALTFGPFVGAFAGGVGSGLSDALHGYVYFSPFTLVIKGAEGFLIGLVVQRGSQRREYRAWFLGSTTMVAGYFFAEAYLIGLAFGSSLNPGLAYALLELPFNILQVSLGGNIGIPLSRYLRRSLPSVLGR